MANCTTAAIDCLLPLAPSLTLTRLVSSSLSPSSAVNLKNNLSCVIIHNRIRGWGGGVEALLEAEIERGTFLEVESMEENYDLWKPTGLFVSVQKATGWCNLSYWRVCKINPRMQSLNWKKKKKKEGNEKGLWVKKEKKKRWSRNRALAFPAASLASLWVVKHGHK